MKGGSLRNSKRFIDQLQRYGLNTAKELANGLMALPPEARFEELRKLLPYLIPKLKEIDPIDNDEQDSASAPISDEKLLEALKGNGRANTAPTKPSPSPVPVVEARNPDVQTPSRPEDDLREVGGEQDTD